MNTRTLLDVFRDVVNIPAVTFHEYLMFEYLSEFWYETRRVLPTGVQKKLEIGYTACGHLKVQWNGAHEHRQRLIMIAHTDREGFLISKVAKEKRECDGSFGSYQFSSETLRGRPVEICLKDGIHEAKIIDDSGNGKSVKFKLGDKLPGHVNVIESREFIGLGYYKLEPFEIEKESGFVSSPCVDNCAGISVVTDSVARACFANESVNMGIIYTTCEEAGLSGIVKYILDASHDLRIDESVWVVVDCSNRFKYVPESFPTALLSPCPTLEQSVEREVDLRTTVIRTGDSRSTFTRSVSHLLFISALNAVVKIGLTVSQHGMRPTAVSYAGYSKWPKLREWISQGGIVGGRMKGGACEGTPLVVAGNILKEFGQPAIPRSLRVGALAIPISNFRNTFKGQIARERCHIAPLMVASELLIEAAKGIQRYPWYLIDSIKDCAIADNVEDTVMRLGNWFRENEARLNVTGAWAGRER